MCSDFRASHLRPPRRTGLSEGPPSVTRHPPGRRRPEPRPPPSAPELPTGTRWKLLKGKREKVSSSAFLIRGSVLPRADPRRARARPSRGLPPPPPLHRPLGLGPAASLGPRVKKPRQKLPRPRPQPSPPRRGPPPRRAGPRSPLPGPRSPAPPHPPACGAAARRPPPPPLDSSAMAAAACHRSARQQAGPGPGAAHPVTSRLRGRPRHGTGGAAGLAAPPRRRQPIPAGREADPGSCGAGVRAEPEPAAPLRPGAGPGKVPRAVPSWPPRSAGGRSPSFY